MIDTVETDGIIDVEGVEVPQPGHELELAPHVTRTIVLTPDQAREEKQRIRDVIQASLTSGTDYGNIPGTGKPSLFKAGAEWLLKWYGYRVKFDTPEYEHDAEGRKWGVTYRCIVVGNGPDGDVTIAECDAYASRDESKWKSAPWNTILKMAQKRALVGAALLATGTSGVFSQDVEDYAQSTEEETPPPEGFTSHQVAADTNRAVVNLVKQLAGYRTREQGGPVLGTAAHQFAAWLRAQQWSAPYTKSQCDSIEEHIVMLPSVPPATDERSASSAPSSSTSPSVDVTESSGGTEGPDPDGDGSRSGVRAPSVAVGPEPSDSTAPAEDGTVPDPDGGPPAAPSGPAPKLSDKSQKQRLAMLFNDLCRTCLICRVTQDGKKDAPPVIHQGEPHDPEGPTVAEPTDKAVIIRLVSAGRTDTSTELTFEEAKIALALLNHLKGGSVTMVDANFDGEISRAVDYTDTVGEHFLARFSGD